MALNLRNKIQKSDKLMVYDLNEKATAKFTEETSSVGYVEVLKSVKDVADQAVSLLIYLNLNA